MGSRFSRGQCLEIGVDADDDLIADTICLADFDSELRTLDALHNSIQSQEVNLLVDADIHPTELQRLCGRVREIFLKEETLLELMAPIKVVGDLHGQYKDLAKIFEVAGSPPFQRFLFLGDYVDRTQNGLEVLAHLFSLKIMYPDRIFILRGNHESSSLTKHYGFYDECKRRMNIKVWRSCCDVFDAMPVCAIIGGRIYCSHGGLSPSLKTLDDIRNLQRPMEIPSDGLLADILWSDPSDDLGWSKNSRGISYTFGPDVIESFKAKFSIDLICRGHQVVEDGYKFGQKRSIVTIFSAPNYCSSFDNAAAVLIVGKEMKCSFHVFPAEKGTTKQLNRKAQLD